MKKLSASTKQFLEYSFKGNGKYYTTECGSRHYRNTLYGNFLRLNTDCIEIIESGNDAPRGGATGEYHVVRFTEKFFEKFADYFKEKAQQAEKRDSEAKERAKKIEALGDQAENLRKYFSEHPGKAEVWDEKTNNMNSQKWRGWLRMKAASKVADGQFELLTLSATEILKIMRDSQDLKFRLDEF